MRTALAFTLALLTLGATPIDRVPPTEVHITFSGVMTHVLDPAQPARAILHRGDGHLLHRATLILRAEDIESSDIALSCDAEGVCSLPLDGANIRFDRGFGHPTYDAGGSFDMLVPHLRAVTGGAMTTVRDDPRNTTFALPAGRYSATPHEDLGLFVPDLERRGVRGLAREVFLVSRMTSPRLQLRIAGKTRTIVFREDDELIELRITNEPMHAAGADHFDLNYDLSATPLAARPALTTVSDARGLSVPINACTNTTWP